MLSFRVKKRDNHGQPKYKHIKKKITCIYFNMKRTKDNQRKKKKKRKSFC